MATEQSSEQQSPIDGFIEALGEHQDTYERIRTLTTIFGNKTLLLGLVDSPDNYDGRVEKAFADTCLTISQNLPQQAEDRDERSGTWFKRFIHYAIKTAQKGDKNYYNDTLAPHTQSFLPKLPSPTRLAHLDCEAFYEPIAEAYDRSQNTPGLTL